MLDDANNASATQEIDEGVEDVEVQGGDEGESDDADVKAAPAPGTKKVLGKRVPSEETVKARAARMAKGELTRRAQQWARSLGLKDVNQIEDFEKHLSTLAKEREKGMSEVERSLDRMRDVETENATLRRDLELAKQHLNKVQREHKRELQRRQDAEVVQAVRDAAYATGVQDVNYATHLFREHVSTDGRHRADPKAFFESLKRDATKKFMFGETAVPAGPPTAEKQQQQGQQAQAKERPQEGGDPVPAKQSGDDVNYDAFREKSKRDFHERTQAKYGFRPTM